METFPKQTNRRRCTEEAPLGASLRSLSSVNSSVRRLWCLSWCHVTGGSLAPPQGPWGLRPSLKFTLATAGGSLSPLHELCTPTPCPSQTLSGMVSPGACKPARTLCPLLRPGLSLSSGSRLPLLDLAR